MVGMSEARVCSLASWRGASVALVGALLVAGCDRPTLSSTAADPVPPAVVAEPPVVFGAVADVQYCDCDAKRTRYYRESVQKLREAMERIAGAGADFTVSVGDIIDREFESYAIILPEFRAGPAGDRHYVLGNHEWKVDAADKSRVLGTLGLESRYDCFGIDGWRFLILDGTELSTYATVEGSEDRLAADALLEDLTNSGAMNAKAYNGAVSPEQLLWLHDELEQAEAAGERVLVFSHFPAQPPEGEACLWNDGDVRWILDQFSDVVVAHINGHDHRGGYAEAGGIHYLTLNAMVETEDQNAFAIFRLYQNRVEVEGHGRQPSYTWSLR